MNTQEYINELKIHLRKLNDDDREDAISYYFEYLAEAGPDGAAEAMKKLGSPAELAAGIRADQAMQDFEEVERPGGDAVGKGVRAVWLAGLAAVPRYMLAVFVSIIVIIVFFAVMIALFASSVGLMGSGVIAFGSGIWLISQDLAAAAFYGGLGIVAVACGFLLFNFSIWCSKHLLHGIAAVFNGIRRKRGKTVKAQSKRSKKDSVPTYAEGEWARYSPPMEMNLSPVMPEHSIEDESVPVDAESETAQIEAENDTAAVEPENEATIQPQDEDNVITSEEEKPETNNTHNEEQ